MTYQKPDNKNALKLASLDEITRVLGASFNLDKLLNLILTTMLKQTDSDSGSLMLINETQEELSIRASKGIPKNIVKKTRIKVGEGIAGIVAKKKCPLLIDNKTFFSIFGKKPRKKLLSSLSIPIIVSNNFIGVINLNRARGVKKFTDDDLQSISRFTTESAIAIHNAKLYIAAEEKIQHLFRFNVISCALNSARDQEKVIEVLTDCIHELFTFDFYSLLLVEKDCYRLFIISQNKISNKTISFLKSNLSLVIKGIKKENFNLDTKIHLSIKKIQGNTRPLKYNILPRHISSILNAPISIKGDTLGMISVYSVYKNNFNQKDQQSLTTLANQTAIALENTNLYKSLRSTYLSTIKALAQAIEEKDVYTRGHSELVSYYSIAIARALQLPNKLIEGIQIAGILHDIGKIGIPEGILSKPGKLTFQEYEIIKNHPIIGKRILDPVNFYWAEPSELIAENAKALKHITKIDAKIRDILKHTLEATLDIIRTTDLSEEIKTMIYHHHERYGGGGYPDGIKGDKIPIGSRILAVADTFEAMTADRPYRKAFPVKKTLQLIKECAPGQLDPKIVNLFIELIKKKCLVVKPSYNTL